MVWAAAVNLPLLFCDAGSRALFQQIDKRRQVFFVEKEILIAKCYVTMNIMNLIYDFDSVMLITKRNGQPNAGAAGKLLSNPAGKRSKAKERAYGSGKVPSQL